MQTQEGLEALDEKLGAIIRKISATVAEKGQTLKTQMEADTAEASVPSETNPPVPEGVAEKGQAPKTRTVPAETTASAEAIVTASPDTA